MLNLRICGDLVMKKKTLDIIRIIWLVIFLIDIICAFTISRPIFMLESVGGERTDYYGLGYSMTHWHSWHGDGGFSINPLIYLILNGLIIVLSLRNRKHRE